MSGISVELHELIALKQHAQRAYAPQRSRARSVGNHSSTLKGRGMDFDEVRSYQAGDDIRHMEWRVTARTGTPHIKLYREECERPVILVVDFNPSMYFATQVAFKSVIASRLAALIAWTAVKHGDRVGSLLFSADKHLELKPRGRTQGVLPLLNALSQYSQTLPQEHQVSSMSSALQRLRRVAMPGSLVYILSDFYSLDEQSKKHLSRLSQHLDIVGFHLKDIIEVQAPPAGCYAMTNGEQELVLDTRQNTIRRNYQGYFEQRQGQLQQFFNQYAIPLVTVLPTDNITDIVHQTYCQQTRRQYG